VEGKVSDEAKRFRVAVKVVDVWEYWVVAKSEEQAETEAEEMFNTGAESTDYHEHPGGTEVLESVPL